MKDIMAESKTDNWLLNEDGNLVIAGHVLNQDEFELRLVLKEGLQGQALPDNTAVVQLDTTLYPELEQEGIARDFVRLVQTMRKENGLDVSDRIEVLFVPSTLLIEESLNKHHDYVMEQVLAVNMEKVGQIDSEAVDLGDGVVQISVRKI